MNLLQSINNEINQSEEIAYLEEAGLIKKGLGKMAGAIGMKGTAANLQAKGDADQKIKQLKIAFQKFAGQMGKTLKTASVDDLQAFFKSKNLPMSNSLTAAKKGSNLQAIPSNELNKAFQVAIQGGAKRNVRQQATEVRPAAQPQQSGKQQATAQTPQAAAGGKLQQAIANLSATQANSLISALQGAT